jgi:putative AbiEi antitoxin of type IV toxin-antitoxin system
VAIDQESTAKVVRKRILASRDRIWRTQDFKGSRDAVQAELRRLVRAGEIERIRRGVYWRGRKTRFGLAVADEGRALRKVLGGHKGIGAAGWYATNLLGLSTQVSPIEVLAVTGRPPTGFPHLKLIDRSQRTGRRDARLNDLEITLLEALEGWDKYVEQRPVAAVDRFQELLSSGRVRIPRLVDAATTEPAVVRERLRRLLIEGGWDGDATRIERARSDSARERALSVFPAVRPLPAGRVG